MVKRTRKGASGVDARVVSDDATMVAREIALLITAVRLDKAPESGRFIVLSSSGVTWWPSPYFCAVWVSLLDASNADDLVPWIETEIIGWKPSTLSHRWKIAMARTTRRNLPTRIIFNSIGAAWSKGGVFYRGELRKRQAKSVISQFDEHSKTELEYRIVSATGLIRAHLEDKPSKPIFNFHFWYHLPIDPNRLGVGYVSRLHD